MQPCFNILNRRLRWVILSTSSMWVGHGHLWRMYYFLPLGKWGSPVATLWVHFKWTSLDPQEDTSLGSGSITGSQKVTLPSNWCPPGDLGCPSKDQLHSQPPPWPWGWGPCAPPPTNPASQCHFPVHGQPWVPTDGPPWLPESLILWVFPPPWPRQGFYSSLWHIFLGCGGVALPMQPVSQRGQDVPDCPFSPLGPARWWRWVIFSTSICCGRGLWSLCGKSGTLQVLWWVLLPLGLALVGSASGLIEWTSLPPSAPAQQHAETYDGGWWTDWDLLSPIWGIHLTTIWHRVSVLPPW